MFGRSEGKAASTTRSRIRPAIEGLESRRLLTGNPPTAVDDMFSTARDVAATLNVLANDTDPEADPLTSSLVQGPTSGQVTHNPDGTFTYTPNSGFVGNDTFTYMANDGTSNSNVATVTITVGGGGGGTNSPPVAVDDTASTATGAQVTIAVLANDTDADGDPLTPTIVTGAQNGLARVNADGTITYTPGAGFSGTDSFTYRDNDGTADGNDATVTITVGNGSPIAVDDSATTDEDTPVTIAVLANDSPNAQPSTVQVVAAPTHGTSVVNADGTITYTPASNYSGSDSFTYRVNDGTGFSDPATVTVTIAPVNDPPVAVDDTATVQGNGSVSINVLANDTDAEGDPLTVALGASPAHGTAVVNADGTITYTPTAGYRGSDTFTYTDNDGNATSTPATVTVTVGNNSPVAVADSATTPEDTPVTIAVLANDTDADNDTLTVAVAAAPTHGMAVVNADGTITYTPAANYNGADTFSYTVTDGQGGTATGNVSVTITAVNDAPAGVADTYSTPKNTALTVATPGVLANDTDAEGGALTASVVTNVTHGTLALSGDGSFVYTPTSGFVGTDTFTYRASDGALSSDPITVTITVANRTPSATSDVYTTPRNAALTVAAPGLLANDTDADGDPLTASVVTNPAHGTLTLNADGSFTYTPTSGFVGTDVFTYAASDSSSTSPATSVTIVVGSNDRVPSAKADAYSVAANGVLVIGPPGVLSNDTDADSDPLTAKVGTNPSHGTLALNANGSFTYTPVAGYTGTDSFTYVANDGFIDSSPATVTIAVQVATPGTSLTAYPATDVVAGVSGTDALTSVKTPTFVGLAPAGSTIRLFAQDSSGTLTQVGTATAIANGTYSVTASSLADGRYQFIVTSDGLAGVGGQSARLAPLVIDTAGPRVAFVTLAPRQGRIFVSFDTTIGDLNFASLTSPANYQFLRAVGRSASRAVAITSISVFDGSTVAIVLQGGRRLAAGSYRLAISRGLVDLAGNGLDGEYFGQLPSGDGTPGGNFLARFDTNGRTISGPMSVAPVQVLGVAATPSGPIALARVNARKRAN